MNRYYIVTLCVIFVVAAAVGVLYIRNMSVEDCVVISLDQDDEFYTRHRDATLKYLVSVYPLSQQKLEKMDPKTLASVYNTLDVVAHCCYTYSGRFSREGWKQSPCCDASPRIPYIPQGYIYAWIQYKTLRTVSSYSDSKTLDEYEYDMQSVGSYNASDISNEIGPGPTGISPYSIAKNKHYPYGPLHVMSMNKWTYVDGINHNRGNNMGFICETGPWAFGVESNKHVEVVPVNVGSSSIFGTKMHALYGGGSGVFYDVGKTLVAVNKIDALCKLIAYLATTDDGKYFLNKYYNTTDMYKIITGYLVPSQAWDAHARVSGGKLVIRSDTHMSIPNTGILRDAQFFKNIFGREEDVSFHDIAVWHAKEHGHENSSIETRYKLSIDCIRKCENYITDRACLVQSLDEPLYWMACVSGVDTIQMTINPNYNGTWATEILDTRYPAEYASDIRSREYKFLEYQSVDSDVITYTSSGVVKFIAQLSKYMSQRDRF